jgi:hypothetical protein
MRTIHFNTGRKYTVNGQRVTATLHDDDVVTFYDHDRMVDGEFALMGEPFTQATVMKMYDHNHAQCTKRSWQDGILKGGVNATYQK